MSGFLVRERRKGGGECFGVSLKKRDREKEKKSLEFCFAVSVGEAPGEERLKILQRFILTFLN